MQATEIKKESDPMQSYMNTFVCVLADKTPFKSNIKDINALRAMENLSSLNTRNLMVSQTHIADKTMEEKFIQGSIIYADSKNCIGYALFDLYYPEDVFSETAALLELVISSKYKKNDLVVISLIQSVMVRLRELHMTRLIYKVNNYKDYQLKIADDLLLDKRYLTVCGFTPVLSKKINKDGDILELRLSEKLSHSGAVVNPEKWSSFDYKYMIQSVIDIINQMKNTYDELLMKTDKGNGKRFKTPFKGCMSLGIKEIIKSYRDPKVHLPWDIDFPSGNVSSPFDDSFSVDSNDDSKDHNKAMSAINMIATLGLIALPFNEFVIVDTSLIVRKRKNDDFRVIPLGVIDQLFYDPINKCIVISDTKTSFKKGGNKYDFLKLEYRMQLEFYAFIMNRLLKTIGSSMRVGYTTMMCFNFVTGFACTWKMPLEPDVYLTSTNGRDALFSKEEIIGK